MRGVLVAAGAAVSLLASPARAVTIQIGQTFDLGLAVQHSGRGLAFLPDAFAPFDVTARQGDTVVLRVDFLPGQTLTAPKLILFDGIALEKGTVSARVFADVLTFFTAAGPVSLPPAGQAGGVFLDLSSLIEDASVLAGAPSAFTGFSIALPVDLVGSSSMELIGEGFDFFEANGDFRGAHFIQGPPFPEPSTWALMMVGFGGLGMALRRQRDRTRLPA